MDPMDARRVSLAVYLDRYNAGNYTYVALVVMMLGVIVSLPFVFTEVSVGSPGVLRPISVSTPIKSFSSGVVVESRARENLRVTKGAILVRVHSVELEERQIHARKRLAELTALAGDVGELSRRVSALSRDSWFSWTPATPLYQQWLADFQQRYGDGMGLVKKTRRDHERSRTLFQGDVIAANEMEQADEELRKSEAAVARLVQTQLMEWRQLAVKYEEEIASVTKVLVEAGRAEALSQIVAPVNGTLHQIAGLYPGSPVFSGQEVGYISPDTTLVAEVHVAPGDIGLIRERQPVRFQIAAYNYNEWGLLEGEVLEVSDDVVFADNVAYYVVRCRTSRNYLQLSNGYRGTLRKGMSLQARFIVGRRSLWQLLYDKVDDWVNPTL
jgi:multidrug resistance efflux pump